MTHACVHVRISHVLQVHALRSSMHFDGFNTMLYMVSGENNGATRRLFFLWDR